MHTSIQHAVEKAIASLSTRHVFKADNNELEVRTLFPVQGWKLHTRQSGSLVLGEDSCGNFFLYAPDGSVSFWDHETEEETILARTIEGFCDSLIEPSPVVLRPEQVIQAWIDPDLD